MPKITRKAYSSEFLGIQQSSKIFKKYYASKYAGINGESSSLDPEGDFFNKALNLEMSVSDSWRGRVGCQVAGDTGNFYGIFPYTYTRTQDEYALTYGATTLTTSKTAADGASITKLIGINKQMWVLDNMVIPITNTVGSTATYAWYSTVGGSLTTQLNIKLNGSVFCTVDLGDGVGVKTSIWSALSSIDGFAQLAVSRTTRGTCPPFAIVNGNQTTALSATFYTYGTAYTVTVTNTPHNFKAGDIITFPNLVAGFVVSQTATTITYVGPQVTLVDTQVLGYMQQAATGFQITTLQTAAGVLNNGTFNLSFPYWRNILASDAGGPSGVADPLYNQFNNAFQSSAALWAAKTPSSFYAPPVGTNAGGCLYIATSGQISDGIVRISNQLVKTDGLAVYRAGLPGYSPTFPLGVTGPYVSGTPQGGALTGPYKYKAFLRRVDAQGNIWDGPIGNIYSVTYAAQSNFIGVGGAIYNDATGWQNRSCYKYTAQSTGPGNFFTVDDNTAAPGLNALMQPGDPVAFLDSTANTVGLWRDAALSVNFGALHRANVIAYDGTTAPSSIKLSGSTAYTILNDSEISTGLTVVILRTTAGGVQYYQLCEGPYTGYTAFQFADNVTDTVLTGLSQYIEVTLGKEHNSPPPCSLVCQHQGGLVTARNPLAPNTVAFSTADGIEYFPVASNNFDVPSTQTGPITAIASDVADRLAVFKERAYYEAQGDLDGGTFNVNVVHEGDYGITSQASLVRVLNSLIGLSRNGYIIIAQGYLDPQRFRGLSTRVMNQNYNFAWAVATNDSFNRNYICTIPITGAEPVSHVIDYSRTESTPFQRDFSSNVKTFERSYGTQIDQGAGMCMVGDTMYHISQSSPYAVYRRLYRFNGDSPSGNGNSDSFIDNNTSINYILETQAINFGEPGQLKMPIRVRVWSLTNDYIIDGWVTFSTLVESGMFPNASFIGSASNGGTANTITFSTANDLFKDIKLKGYKSHFFMVRLTTNAIRTTPFWTGFEIMFADDYQKEDFGR